MQELKFVKLNNRAISPKKSSDVAAGYDIYVLFENPYEQVRIQPGATMMLHTGIAIEIPDNNVFGAVFARSGIASKRGLRPANCVGVIDPDYRGEIMVALHNDSSDEQVIYNGDKIAQLVFMPFISYQFTEVDELSDTKRDDGGFGSTGR